MNKITKFLLKLNKNERLLILKILEDILNLNLQNYDIKALKGYNSFFRLRKGNIRIIFEKQNKKGITIDIDYRKNIYKKK